MVCWVSRDKSLPPSPVELQSTYSSWPWIVWFKDGGLELWQPFCAKWENPRAGGGCRAANTEWSLKRKSPHQRTDPSFHEMIYLGWGCWVPGSVLAWETLSCPSSRWTPSHDYLKGGSPACSSLACCWQKPLPFPSTLYLTWKGGNWRLKGAPRVTVCLSSIYTPHLHWGTYKGFIIPSANEVMRKRVLWWDCSTFGGTTG